MDKLKVLELFAGIGACSKALTNLGVPHEIVDAVEIDKYAVQSFNAIHGTNFEPQDITKWDKDIECDLIMHGSPCQDFSVAGKQAGGDKDSGTRSSLMYETLRIVEKLKPKYVIWENVKNLLSKNHRHNFDAYIDAMADLGYVSKYQVLNAKDYGVPQNRERVFTISCRHNGDTHMANAFLTYFNFPQPIPLDKRLKDVLEDEVDEKYYLSDEQTARLRSTTYNSGSEKVRVQDDGGVARTLCARDYKDPKCVQVAQLYGFGKERNPQAGRVYDQDGICPTMSTMQGGNQEPKIVASRGRGDNNEQHLEQRNDGLTNTITSVQKDNYVIVDDIYKNREPRVYPKTAPTIRANHAGDLKVMGGVAIKTANKKGYDMAANGDSIDLAYPSSQTRRGRVGHGVAKTLATTDTMGTMQGLRIRKLTPKECWRLMGFSDEDFNKAQASGVSNSQLYKQAGNSIVVNVLEGILKNLLEDEYATS